MLQHRINITKHHLIHIFLDNIHDSVIRLQNLLLHPKHSIVHQFYLNREQQILSKKNRELSGNFNQIRYNDPQIPYFRHPYVRAIVHQFKCGFYAEVRNDIKRSLAQYHNSYQQLLEVIKKPDLTIYVVRNPNLSFSSQNLTFYVKREHLYGTAEFINFKICDIYLTTNRLKSAIGQFRRHIMFFKRNAKLHDLKSRFCNWAWLSQQYCIFADLLIRYQNRFKPDLLDDDWEICGFHYLHASKYAMLRQKESKDIHITQIIKRMWSILPPHTIPIKMRHIQHDQKSRSVIILYRHHSSENKTDASKNGLTWIQCYLLKNLKYIGDDVLCSDIVRSFKKHSKHIISLSKSSKDKKQIETIISSILKHAKNENECNLSIIVAKEKMIHHHKRITTLLKKCKQSYKECSDRILRRCRVNMKNNPKQWHFPYHDQFFSVSPLQNRLSWIRQQLGVQYLQNGQYDKACQIFSKVIPVYRRHHWLTLLDNALFFKLTCSKKKENYTSYIKSALELVSPTSQIPLQKRITLWHEILSVIKTKVTEPMSIKINNNDNRNDKQIGQRNLGKDCLEQISQDKGSGYMYDNLYKFTTGFLHHSVHANQPTLFRICLNSYVPVKHELGACLIRFTGKETIDQILLSPEQHLALVKDLIDQDALNYYDRLVKLSTHVRKTSREMNVDIGCLTDQQSRQVIRTCLKDINSEVREKYFETCRDFLEFVSESMRYQCGYRHQFKIDHINSWLKEDRKHDDHRDDNKSSVISEKMSGHISMCIRAWLSTLQSFSLHPDHVFTFTVIIRPVRSQILSCDSITLYYWHDLKRISLNNTKDITSRDHRNSPLDVRMLNQIVGLRLCHVNKNGGCRTNKLPSDTKAKNKPIIKDSVRHNRLSSLPRSKWNYQQLIVGGHVDILKAHVLHNQPGLCGEIYPLSIELINTDNKLVVKDIHVDVSPHPKIYKMKEGSHHVYIKAIQPKQKRDHKVFVEIKESPMNDFESNLFLDIVIVYNTNLCQQRITSNVEIPIVQSLNIDIRLYSRDLQPIEPTMYKSIVGSHKKDSNRVVIVGNSDSSSTQKRKERVPLSKSTSVINNKDKTSKACDETTRTKKSLAYVVDYDGQFFIRTEIYTPRIPLIIHNSFLKCEVTRPRHHPQAMTSKHSMHRVDLNVLNSSCRDEHGHFKNQLITPKHNSNYVIWFRVNTKTTLDGKQEIETRYKHHHDDGDPIHEMVKINEEVNSMIPRYGIDQQVLETQGAWVSHSSSDLYLHWTRVGGLHSELFLRRYKLPDIIIKPPQKVVIRFKHAQVGMIYQAFDYCVSITNRTYQERIFHLRVSDNEHFWVQGVHRGNLSVPPYGNIELSYVIIPTKGGKHALPRFELSDESNESMTSKESPHFVFVKL